MPTYNKKTWSTEELATSTGLNQMSDNIELALRGLASDIQYARGRKQFTVLSGTDNASVTVAFATDPDDGDPAFSGAPRVYATLEFVDSFTPQITSQTLSAITANSFKFKITFDSNMGSDTDFAIQWFAVGPA